MCVEVCGDGIVVIEFVDYGNSERVSRERLFELPGDLLTTPIQVRHTIMFAFSNSFSLSLSLSLSPSLPPYLPLLLRLSTAALMVYSLLVAVDLSPSGLRRSLMNSTN
jgi:hypothetical protein